MKITNRPNREIQRILDLAGEYKKKGYTVVREPDTSFLPASLTDINYSPDLLLTKGNEHIIVEVKSQESMKELKNLEQVTDIVNGIKGWEFMLVFTNPASNELNLSESKIIDQIALNNFLSDLSNKVNLSKTFSNSDIFQIFLGSWAVFEGAMRFNIQSFSKKSLEKATTNVLLKECVMLGAIKHTDYQFVESFLNKRNNIAHGFLDISITVDEIKKLLEISKSIINMTLVPSGKKGDTHDISSWLSSADPEGAEEFYSLYKAVEEEKHEGIWEVNRIGGRLFVRAGHVEETLILESDSDKDAFLAQMHKSLLT